MLKDPFESPWVGAPDSDNAMCELSQQGTYFYGAPEVDCQDCILLGCLKLGLLKVVEASCSGNNGNNGSGTKASPRML